MSKAAVSTPPANEAGETALDVARRMRHLLCEELVRHCLVTSLVWGHGPAAESSRGLTPMWTSCRVTHAPQQLQCHCGMQGRVQRGPAGTGPGGMGSLRAEQFGTGQAGTVLCLGRGIWTCIEAAWGECISSASPSLASAMSFCPLIWGFARPSYCWEALLTACRLCPGGCVVSDGASNFLWSW